MKHEKYLIISCILAIGYITIAYFFYGWAFYMVPYRNINAKAVLDVFMCIYLFALGILLLISSFGISRNKSYGYKIFRITFWFGLIVLLCGSVAGATIVLNNILIGILQIGFVMGIFYLPIAILYLSQRRKLLDDK